MNLRIDLSYNKIMSGLFFLFIILLPFQDSGLSETPLRMFGLYLSNLPLMMMIALSVVNFMVMGRIKKEYKKYIGVFIYIFIYSLLVTVFRSDDISTSIYKIITNSILLIFMIISFYYSRQYFSVIKKYIWLVFLINLLGCLFCDILSIDFGTFIHRSSAEYGRFRGFTSEASWFGYTTVLLGFLAAECSSVRMLRYGYFILAIVIAFIGGSKGTIACIPLAVFLYFIFGIKKHIYLKCISIPFSLFVIYEVFSIFLLDNFILDLSEATSFSTRISSMIAGLLIFIHYPFGTGYGSFVPILKEFFLQGYDLLNQYIPVYILSYSEIMSTVQDPQAVGLTIKNNFIQYLTLFGVPFIYVLYYLAKRLILIFSGCSSRYIIPIYFIIISLFSFAQLYYDTIVAIVALSILAQKGKNNKARNNEELNH